MRSFTEGRVIPLASLVSPHGLMNAPQTPAASSPELKRRQPEVFAGDPRTTSAQILMVPPCQRNDTETPRICCCASRKSPTKLLKSFCTWIKHSVGGKHNYRWQGKSWLWWNDVCSECGACLSVSAGASLQMAWAPGSALGQLRASLCACATVPKWWIVSGFWLGRHRNY